MSKSSKLIIAFVLTVLGSIIGIAPAAATDEIFIPPTPIERFYPADGMDITSSESYVKHFYWDRIDGIDWYHVVIVRYGEIQFDKWYEASESCDESDGYCMSGDIWLSGAGQYDWWMTRWNESIGQNYTLMYEKSSFSLNIPQPNPPQGAGLPSGEITDNTPTIFWNNGLNALWYEVWVGPADYSETDVQGWYERAIMCDYEGCALDVEDTLGIGDYEVWMRSWNPTDTSNWVKTHEFSVELGKA